MLAEVTIYAEEHQMDVFEEEAMVRCLQEKIDEFSGSSKLSRDLLRQFKEISDVYKLANQLCNDLPMDYVQRQKFLEAIDIKDRCEELLSFMGKEAEIFKITREIQEKVKAKIDKNQKEYILREQMKVIREELGESNTVSDAEEFEAQLQKIKGR